MGKNGHVNGATLAPPRPDENGTLELRLTISDPELYAALYKRDKSARERLATAALKVGVAALRQAQGQIDAHQIRDAGEQVIRDMSASLEKHRRDTAQQVSDCIREYFDPKSGLFSQRVRKLVGQGDEAGELERVIRRQIDGDGSRLANTLAAHVGGESQLMRVLDPDSTQGVITRLAQSTETALAQERDRILSEFSLNNGDGALSRLVAELTRSHGDVGKALEQRIGAVMGEFSLDRADSALSRLVGRVESAHRQISNEFSLDNDGSALARMRRELLGSH